MCYLWCKKTDCIQKTFNFFNFKNIINFCGFNIKIENLIILHCFYDGTTLTTISEHNPQKNWNHEELLQKLEEFTRCKNFKIWYIKNLKKKNVFFFMNRFCLRYSQYFSISISTTAFISRYRISRFNGEGGGRGEGGGSAKFGIFLRESPRWEFFGWEFSRWKFSWVEIFRVGIILGGSRPGGSFPGGNFSGGNCSRTFNFCLNFVFLLKKRLD